MSQNSPSLTRSLALTGSAVAAAATVGTIATDPDSRWYRGLVKPSFQPPTWLFPVAWTALYADIAVTSALTSDRLAQEGRDEEQRRYHAALAANLVLNTGWSLLFFRGKRPALATVEAVALAVSSIDLARRSGRVDARHGLALTPYAAWTTFAAVLTAAIARKN